ncbi:MAG TPA: bestrophin family ion channel, partial [Niastella sp.]
MILESKLPFKYLLGIVKYELIIILLVGIVINLGLDVTEFLPEMPLTIPAFLGTSISVLLSFKMSQSYDRWWEARKVWGAITNDSRSLVIQL